jgi:hypothetical protein
LAADVIRAAAKKAGQVAALKLYVIALHTPLQEIVGVLWACSGARVWMGCPKWVDAVEKVGFSFVIAPD